MIQDILAYREEGEIWVREAKVRDSKGKRRNLILTGRIFNFQNGKQEIIRHIDEEFVYVNPVKDYRKNYADIIIGLPIEHFSWEDLLTDNLDYAFVGRFYQRTLQLVKKQYDGPGYEIGSRILLNFEGKYASVKDHMHNQSIITVGTMTHIPSMQSYLSRFRNTQEKNKKNKN